MKVDWSDLKHELEHPEKRAQAYLVTHEFYFAVPEELAQKHRTTKPRYTGLSHAREGTFWEQLGGAGLIAVRENGTSRIEFPAKKREAWPLPDTLIASLLRNLRQDVLRGKQPAVEYDEEVA